MILGIVGSRRRATTKDYNKLRDFIIKARNKIPDLSLVSGGCPIGADLFCEAIAEELFISIIIEYPDESSLPPDAQKYDYTKIYYKRNKLIAEDCDKLIALVTPDRSGGTENSIKHCKNLKKKVIFL